MVRKMGNRASRSTLEELNKMSAKLSKDQFKIERIIAGNCDFLAECKDADRNIRVGIVTNKDDPLNPLGRQAIKIGDSDPFRLHSFTATPEQITYIFDKNVQLSIMKRRDSVIYSLKTADLDITREIDPTIRRLFKTIDMDSAEIDRMKEYMQ